jgi:hypothetical protein
VADPNTIVSVTSDTSSQQPERDRNLSESAPSLLLTDPCEMEHQATRELPGTVVHGVVGKNLEPQLLTLDSVEVGKGTVVHVRPRLSHHEHHHSNAEDVGSEPKASPSHTGPLSIRIQIELSCFIMAVYGFVTVVLSAPTLYIWSATSLEPFVLPSRHKLHLIIVNTALYTLYNGLLVFGILVTTPLFMSVGTMMVMPCSIVVDKLLYHSEMSSLALAGAVVIVIGFVMLNIPQTVASRWFVACKQRVFTSCQNETMLR